MAAAGDQTAVPVAVVITVLGVVSLILAAVALVRPRAATGPVRFPDPSRTPARLIGRPEPGAHIRVRRHWAPVTVSGPR